MTRSARESETADDALIGMEDGDSTEAAGGSSFPAFPGYTVLQKIGAGGFGAVYRARDEKLGREVALKVELRPADVGQETQERFLDEARALARIRHPNVLTVYSVTEYGDRVGLVTELIDGKPLSEIVEELGPFGASEAAGIGIDLCRALAAVHAAGLVHRDVKSPNVLREQGGRIVLTDFGLGVFLAQGRELTQRNLLAGSPLFMAPEQVRGELPQPRTDIYALGVLLYHISTGKFPVTTFELGDLLDRIEKGDIVPLRDARPDLPELFVRVVTRAMTRDPRERYRSAGEMEAALAACTGGASPASASVPAPPRRKRRRIVLCALLAVAGLGVFALRFGPTRSRIHVEQAEVFLESRVGARPLSDGAAVRVGDALFMRFQAPYELHVYVVNEDGRGERFMLFPHRRGLLQNPLEGGVTHRLPGVVAGHDVNWQVSSAGGEETIIVIVSRRRIEELERHARTDAPGSEGLYPELDEDSIEGVLRGIGALVERSTTGDETLREVIEQVTARRNGSAGLWVRKITLTSS